MKPNGWRQGRCERVTAASFGVPQRVLTIPTKRAHIEVMRHLRRRSGRNQPHRTFIEARLRETPHLPGGGGMDF